MINKPYLTPIGKKTTIILTRHKASIILIVIALLLSMHNLFGQCTQPIPTHVTKCAAGSYTLVVMTYNALPGTTHKWYDQFNVEVAPTSQYPLNGGQVWVSEKTEAFNSSKSYFVASLCTSGSVSQKTEVKFIMDCTPPPCSTPLYISPSKDPNTVCAGNEFFLTGKNGTNYKWRFDHPNGPVISTDDKISVTQSGIYYLSADVLCGLTQTAMQITIHAKPLVYISPGQSTKICSTCSQTFTTDNNAGSYVWFRNSSAVPGAINKTFATNQPGNYSLQYTASSTGCFNSSGETPLKVNILPVVSAGPDQIVTFADPSVTLYGSASDEDVVLSSFSWTLVSGPFTPVMEGANTLTLKVSNLRLKGDYIFRLTTQDEMESNSADVKVSVDFPPNNYNYIRTNTLLKEGIKELNEVNLSALGANKLSQSTTYFDGLGRPMQTVQTQGAMNNKDMVQPVIYDKFGRELVKYLPYASSEANGYYKPNATGAEDNTYATSPQYQFYQTAVNVAHDAKPYAVTIAESSPIDRLLEQGAPGAFWQPGAAQNATVKLDYQSNIAGEVQLWEYQPGAGDAFGSIVFIKNFDANTLFKTITYDEHQSQVIEFKDKEGRLILKKVQNDTQYLFTTYIYDDLSQLRAVIQPQGFVELPPAPAANYKLTKDYLDKWCFTYHYDFRNRMTEKKVPGAGKVILIYDKRDRLVLTQDSAQRIRNEWLYTKYDAFNRAVITGNHTDSRSRSAIQTSIDVQSAFFETRNLEGIGYTQSNCYPVNADTSKLISITFYDDYDFLEKKCWDNQSKQYAFTANELIPTTSLYTNVNGLTTGAKIRGSKKKSWEYTVHYYDDNNRAIQSIAKNYSQWLDIHSSHYDFTGKVLESRLTHTGVETDTITQSFDYDHAGRLLRAYHRIGKGAKVLLAQNSYNALGQLTDKGLGVKNNLPLQSVDYRYNIRGWLTSINNSALNNDGSLNDDANDVFGMELLYEKPLGMAGLGINLPPGPLKGEVLPGMTGSVFRGVADIRKYRQSGVLKPGVINPFTL